MRLNLPLDFISWLAGSVIDRQRPTIPLTEPRSLRARDRRRRRRNGSLNRANSRQVGQASLVGIKHKRSKQAALHTGFAGCGFDTGCPSDSGCEALLHGGR